jgi:hypothetical protein
MKLVIDRKTWLRGSAGFSYLRREFDGKKCCLGFLATACGYEDKDITGMETPSEFPSLFAEVPWLYGLIGGNSVDSSDLMTINDAVEGKGVLLKDGTSIPFVTEAVREKFISDTMAKHDIQVEFIN